MFSSSKGVSSGCMSDEITEWAANGAKNGVSAWKEWVPAVFLFLLGVKFANRYYWVLGNTIEYTTQTWQAVQLAWHRGAVWILSSAVQVGLKLVSVAFFWYSMLQVLCHSEMHSVWSSFGRIMTTQNSVSLASLFTLRFTGIADLLS